MSSVLTIPCRTPSLRPCRLYSQPSRHTASQVQDICPRHRGHEDNDSFAAVVQPRYSRPGTSILLCIQTLKIKHAELPYTKPSLLSALQFV